MNERSQMIDWIRGELIGPSRPLKTPQPIEINERKFMDDIPFRRGPVGWRPDNYSELQEVLYFERESPHRKYGAGLLHPAESGFSTPSPDQTALRDTDTIGAEIGSDTENDSGKDPVNGDEGKVETESSGIEGIAESDNTDDFEVTSPDVRHPSTMGISFCMVLDSTGQIIVRMPQHRRFFWQAESSPPVLLNGRYEACTRNWTDNEGRVKQTPIWRRMSAVLPDCEVRVNRNELVSEQVVRKDVQMPEGSPISLRVELFPRRIGDQDNLWLVTVVLRNSTKASRTQEQQRESVLYQSYFEVVGSDAKFLKYPESRRPFEKLDAEEQSLSLLYRESATWAIGHGCAAGWDVELNKAPSMLYADVMPAVQLPSMTPDIEMDGKPVKLSMRALSKLPDDSGSDEWDSIKDLATGYSAWIQLIREEAVKLPKNSAIVANRHIDGCLECLRRLNEGIALLQSDSRVRKAFRLANLAMLLQQIATKQLRRRPLDWDSASKLVIPSAEHLSPYKIYMDGSEDQEKVGSWRAFQIAFLIMSLSGVSDHSSQDREIVDLIWFPTGGGKTEAYLAVIAFYMFHERLLMDGDSDIRRDGTNVLMRYTLRMLTTQQFQRAASLICAMEYLRRNPMQHGAGSIPGKRFSLGLWIGGDGSPNKISEAKIQIGDFRQGQREGNPLVITECPWCRAEIGRYNGPKPKALSLRQWYLTRTKGITEDGKNGPLLLCPDSSCCYGQANPTTWLPVEVIDERIYKYPPSLIIATADKFAIITYRPDARSLFGLRIVDKKPQQEYLPPGLIIQDELHLISGPLGTMYALYEGIYERLCSYIKNQNLIKPKLIASTATIRGAAEQVKSLYSRSKTQLFPSPGLTMGDSFFGKYARDSSGKLRNGRLYLGVHATDYGSVLTTQVRVFSSALFRPFSFTPENRDAWWTVLAFYNSIRELGGARTLFDSDIRSRLKFIFNREDFANDLRRNLFVVEELTSRISQAEIVSMMDRLASPYRDGDPKKAIDACLASNIIEVGVDIDRLSLMGVVGQPKTTATYIQVTGRVGRRWWERPGLILMIYNPSKSRDRSHFEQFHSYHRRLYERVEPTTATPFALSAIQRGLPGALIAWARQNYDGPVQNREEYRKWINAGYDLLCSRCNDVQAPEDLNRSFEQMQRVRDEIEWKWSQNPQEWEDYPQKVDGEYLMLWPGQFATGLQKMRGLLVPSSMRQVDRAAELSITQGYASADAKPITLASSSPTISSDKPDTI